MYYWPLIDLCDIFNYIFQGGFAGSMGNALSSASEVTLYVIDKIDLGQATTKYKPCV